MGAIWQARRIESFNPEGMVSTLGAEARIQAISNAASCNNLYQGSRLSSCIDVANAVLVRAPMLDVRLIRAVFSA